MKRVYTLFFQKTFLFAYLKQKYIKEQNMKILLLDKQESKF